MTVLKLIQFSNTDDTQNKLPSPAVRRRFH